METPVKLIRVIFDLIRISLRDDGAQDAASARHGRALGATWSGKEGRRFRGRLLPRRSLAAGRSRRPWERRCAPNPTWSIPTSEFYDSHVCVSMGGMMVQLSSERTLVDSPCAVNTGSHVPLLGS
jgi:hypothetical protein